MYSARNPNRHDFFYEPLRFFCVNGILMFLCKSTVSAKVNKIFVFAENRFAVGMDNVKSVGYIAVYKRFCLVAVS